MRTRREVLASIKRRKIEAMRNRRQSSTGGDTEIGQDSFLDVVANLVGILVILIMVIGVRARHAWQSAAATPLLTNAAPAEISRPEGLEALMRRVEQKSSAVTELQRDAHRLDAQVTQVSELAAVKCAERNQLQLLVSAAKADLAQRQSALNAADGATIAARQQLADVERELSEVQQALHAVEIALGSQQQKVLLHYTTPLAKMVFGHEEHFRLLNNRLVYVPIEEIANHVRDDAEDKLWKLKDVDQVTETIGPIRGFRVRYTMERREEQVITEAGPMLRRTIELAQFTLVPTADQIGEDVDAALGEDSTFINYLRSLDANDTTVTVWTYPDSYSAYRRLKEKLQGLGFQYAARPMPEGELIGGSPRGSRSAAE